MYSYGFFCSFLEFKMQLFSYKLGKISEGIATKNNAVAVGDQFIPFDLLNPPSYKKGGMLLNAYVKRVQPRNRNLSAFLVLARDTHALVKSVLVYVSCLGDALSGNGKDPLSGNIEVIKGMPEFIIKTRPQWMRREGYTYGDPLEALIVIHPGDVIKIVHSGGQRSLVPHVLTHRDDKLITEPYPVYHSRTQVQVAV